MPKLAYFVIAIALCGSLTLENTMAKDSGRYSHDDKQWSNKGKYKNNHSDKQEGRSHDVGREITYNRTIYKNSPHYNVPPRVYHTQPAPRYYGPKYKPYSYSHYYKPKYVYVKPYYAPRYYGHYPYRGFYWPFVNVAFVADLSARQIERHHLTVYEALDAPVGAIVSWSDDGRRGMIVILRDGFDEYGNICKEYRQTINYRGHVTTTIAVSCLSPEGYWVTP
ncbi:MAG: hypothetical protein K9G33_09795 [Sneathiella sp.]|nr:hypothetical protein [Sneathiella sp.]